MITILQLLILIYSAILHEIAHGWTAEQFGDPTARISGRITLDPRPHIDPLLTFAVPVILFLAGSPVILGGAKPVPIDSFNFQNPKKDITYVSVAGPLTNFILAIIFAILIKILSLFLSPNNPIIELTVFAVIINVFLGLFNLLPIPPLDGFKVVGGLLPDSFASDWFKLERFGILLLVIGLFFFSTVISNILYPAANSIIHFLLPSTFA